MTVDKIKTTRQLNCSWNTHVLVNEDDWMRSYQMTIPARAHADGTTLDWVIRYGNPSKEHLFSALSIAGSYQYLLSANITTEEAIHRLRCLRREYQSQPKPEEARQKGGDA